VSSEFFALTLRQLHERIVSAEVGVADVTEHFLGRIEELNPALNALVHVDPDHAREQATLRQSLIDDKSLVGPLAGIPTADKDLVRRQGMPTGFGSHAREAMVHDDLSDPMAAWVDSVGALSVGKTATSEFGLAGYTEPDHLPPSRNPHNVNHQTGGSSGGAAAAVAAGLIPFAPGSDGGGSIRIPALSCGVTGWKPTRGLIPAGHGLDSPGGLSVAGLITRSADDMAFIAGELMAGQMPTATKAVEREVPTRLRVGVTTTSPWPLDWGIGPDAQSHAAYQRAIDALRSEGHIVEELAWEPDRNYQDYFLTLWAVGAATIEIAPDKEGDLTELTRYLRKIGAQTSGVDYHRALRSHGQFERDTISQFSAVDVVLTPGLAHVAPPVGYFSADPTTNFRQQVEFTPWTSFVNVAGLPAVAFPTLFGAEGLPMGAQLIGAPGSDRSLISVVAEIEHHFSDARVIPRS
jgi:amidase